jgi:TM2 domain-containing membrane protein YozV
MANDTPVWEWVLIGAFVLLVLVWFIYSVMTIYQFAVRGKTISGGRWFVVGFLMFVLIVDILDPKNNYRDEYIFIFIVVLFLGAIIFGAIRNNRRSATWNAPTFRAPTFRTDRRAALQLSGNDDSAGTSAQFEAKYCFECGSVISAKAEICPKCGVRQPTTWSATRERQHGRSKLVASLFALFLGGLGIHKFYLGQVGRGIFYLLFCWTFIRAIVGFIEGIILLSMSESAFASKYGVAR